MSVEHVCLDKKHASQSLNIGYNKIKWYFFKIQKKEKGLQIDINNVPIQLVFLLPQNETSCCILPKINIGAFIPKSSELFFCVED